MHLLIDQYYFCTANRHVHPDQYPVNEFNLSQYMVQQCHILSEGTFFLTRPVLQRQSVIWDISQWFYKLGGLLFGWPYKTGNTTLLILLHVS